MSKYTDSFKNPNWQKKRLIVLSRDSWSCRNCGDDSSQLEVHQLYYVKNKNPWDYPDNALVTFCKDCHDEWHRVKQMLDRQSPYLVAEMEWLVDCSKYGPIRFLEGKFKQHIETYQLIINSLKNEALKKDTKINSQIVDCCIFIEENALNSEWLKL